ncbi:nucleotide-binding protein [Micromonospora zamorensis]|uniref:TIR domain-containing protein n=1 Tax=Micromonospora zamorensis TaxID=709883 RepID=UPI00352AB175|nr:nucleotide-binding protein [Micromonospora zamorensis]
MRIFIGSSREARQRRLLAEVASWIEEVGHTPLRWDAREAVTPGTYTFSALRRIAHQVEGAVFLFSEDDRLWYRGAEARQPRDNVLIEYGLFSAVLGQESVIICREGDPKTASDLLGITHVELSDGKARAQLAVQDWLEQLGSLADSEDRGLLLERLDSPFQASGKRSLFLKGTELVRKATRRVALVAKTPIVIVGCRPYDDSDRPISYESEQLATYREIIRRSTVGDGPDFICVASRAALIEDVAIHRGTTFRARVRHNCEEIGAALTAPGSRVQLRWHEESAPMTFLVSDDDFMIWFKDASGESVWITANDEIIARALYSRAEAMGHVLDMADALSDFEEPDNEC